MVETPTEWAGGDRDREGDTTGADRGERDYGDSAGYGGGGSTLDYDEVLGDENSRRDIGPNPLDAVVQTGKDKDDAEGDTDGTEAAAGPHAKPELTNPDATPGAGALPSATDEGDIDPGAG